MPMCDAYIPAGALAPEVETALVASVSDLLVEHELRRIVELMDPPEITDTMRARAKMIAWSFVHRTDTYVASRPAAAPTYKFVCSIPEGVIDDPFLVSVNRDILQAVTDAEDGRWPHPERRVWVFVRETPDGTWGAAGAVLHLEEIVDFVAPGIGAAAVKRWQDTPPTETGTRIGG